MPPLYVVEQGAKIQKESRRLVVTKDDEVLQSVPLIKVEQVLIFGNVSITTPALVYLMSQGIDVVFCDQYGHYRGRVVGETSGHSELRRWQYRRVDDPTFVLRWNRREALPDIEAVTGLRSGNCKLWIDRSGSQVPREGGGSAKSAQDA